MLLVAYAAYDIRTSYLKEEGSVRTRVANTSFLIGEWIKGAFMASDYVLRDIISQVPLAELRYPDPDPIRQARVTDFLASKLKTLPFAVGVGVSDKNCIVTHTWNIPPRPSVVGFDGSQREWCKLPRTDSTIETFVTNMFFSNTKKLSVNQFRRFPGSETEFNGLAGIGVELEFFSTWLEKIAIGPHGVIAIADMNLSLLARKPALPGALGKKVDDKVVEAFIASKEDYKTFSGRSSLDGEERLFGARKVDGLPFVIVVGESNQDWQSSWRQRIWETAATLLLLWGMAIFTLRHHWMLLRQREVFSEQANTDVLTGIANRRSFIVQAERELNRARRYNSRLAVLVLDIDRFKQINDTYGHATGDRAIVAFSKGCIEAIRDIDFIGRFGGDEFAILLPGTSVEEARVVAERIRHTVASCVALNDDNTEVLMTCSIGATLVEAGEGNVDEALAKADTALYLAKQNGRNRVEFA